MKFKIVISIFSCFVKPFLILFFPLRLLLPSVCSPLLPVRLKPVLMPVPTMATMVMDMAMVLVDIMAMDMVMVMVMP